MQPNTENNILALSQPRPEMVLSDIWIAVRKRKLILLGITLATALLAGIHGTLRGKIYTAVGEIEIQPKSSVAIKTTLSAGVDTSLDERMESEVRILRSKPLLEMAVRTLNLQSNPDFIQPGETAVKKWDGNKVVAIANGDLNDPFVMDILTRKLSAMLLPARLPRTQMISISCTSKSPKLAAQIVNTLENDFIKNNFLVHFNNKQQVSNWLTGQIEDLRSVVKGSQDHMIDLQKRLGISALDPNHSAITSEVTNLQKSVADATQQRVLQEARYRILQSIPHDQILDTTTPIGSDNAGSSLSALRAARASDLAEIAKLSPVYGPNYPQVKQLTAHAHALDEAITQQEHRIVRQAKDAVDVSITAERQAKLEFQNRVNELYGQRDDIAQYELVSQEYESNRQMYEKILTGLREAAVDAGLESSDVIIVNVASVPNLPSSMSAKKIASLGLLVGALLGLIVVILIERVDTRLRDSVHIQSTIGVPSMAIIPLTNWDDKSKGDRAKEGVGPEMLWDPKSSFAESIRVFRTSIQLSSSARQSRVIAISSCQPAEGKSTVATNLAAALAQGGKRVILVDTDMRRPSVFWRLGLSAKRGLSEYLTGNETIENVIQKHETLSNLDLIPSGFSPPLPADLLASGQMASLVKYLRDNYEYVIFDTPPVLSVTDPLIVASHADGVVLVIRQGYCTKDMLARAATIFRDVEIKTYGFVLNGVIASLPEYYGYMGYYSYEYKK